MNGNKLYNQFIKSLFILFALIIITPIFFGFIGFFLPSFGYFPVLDKYDFNLSYFIISFEMPGILKSISLSFFTGFCSTILALFFSQLILSYFFNTKTYNYLKYFISPFLALPHITMAVGIIFLFSPSGLFFRLISPWLTGFERPPNFFIIPDEYGFFLILGLVLKEIPFFILISLSALEQLPTKKIFKIGKTLQHSYFSIWAMIIFPLIYKKIRLVIFIVIAFSASVIDMSLLLAPSTPSTLSIRALKAYQSAEFDSIFIASNLALIQFLVIIVLMVCWVFLEKIVQQKHFFLITLNLLSRKKSFFKNILYFTSLTLFSFSILGIVCAFLWSIGQNWYFPKFFPGSLSIDNILVFFKQNKDIVFVSIYISLIVSLLSLLIIVIWVELTEVLNFKHFYFEWFFFLPLFIPEISFLIGLQSFLIIFNFNSFFIPLIVTELLYIMPYSFIILAPALREIKKDYIKVGSSLGKSRFQRLIYIKVPLIIPSIFTAFAIGMIISLSLYTPVYFIGAGRITTLTVEALNLALSNSRQDLGVATVFQVLIPILILLIVAYFNRKLTKWSF